ncbi:MAG: T9SS type A sorting domain-containing protein [Bacteroidales bacterium]|nr:T9SS type A sorting domain-containing protein [Bacteroidales bacterium]
MNKIIFKKMTFLGLLALLLLNCTIQAATVTSAQSGLFSIGSTWVGGVAPALYDDIVIATGHTVTLDANITIFNITIQTGAILDNSTYTITIDNGIASGNPTYTNNGTHNGTGNIITYSNYDTEITGSGITNCTFEIVNYGLKPLNDCNLTINGNVQHQNPGNTGMNGKYLIQMSFGNLTINGNIITDATFGAVGITTSGTIAVNGNVSMLGSTDSGGGASIVNSGTINISGDLTLGVYASFCQNDGSMIIGGDLLGSGLGDSYFWNGLNATVKLGGNVFPDPFTGLFFGITEPAGGSSTEPNTIEYNGVSAQTIRVPDDAAYSNLIINNSSSGLSLIAEITVNGILTLTDGIVNLGSNNLILAENATVAGTPSAENMVIATGTGELRKVVTNTGSFTFPVGDNDGTAEYSPVTLDFTSGTFNSAYAGVNLVNEAWSGVSGNYLNRYWNLTSEGITDFSCNASFDYVPADVTGIEDSIYCYRVTPTTDRYSVTDVVLHRLTATGINSLGTFTGREQGFPFAFEVTGTGSYCDGGDGLPVGLSGSETGVVYTLYKDGVAEASMAGTGSAISFGIQLPATYTITGTNDNGTTPMSGNAVITENPLPVVTWTTFEPTIICIEDWGPVTLTGGLPEGGVYSGDGVTGNIFNQAVAGVGSHIITYTYSDENSCSNQATMELFVDACLGVTENNKELLVYPNPVSDMLTIGLPDNRVIREIALFNLMGIKVFEKTAMNASGPVTLSVQDIPSGNYIIRITGNDESIVKPIILK